MKHLVQNHIYNLKQLFQAPFGYSCYLNLIGGKEAGIESGRMDRCLTCNFMSFLKVLQS